MLALCAVVNEVYILGKFFSTCYGVSFRDNTQLVNGAIFSKSCPHHGPTFGLLRGTCIPIPLQEPPSFYSLMNIETQSCLIAALKRPQSLCFCLRVYEFPPGRGGGVTPICMGTGCAIFEVPFQGWKINFGVSNLLKLQTWGIIFAKMINFDKVTITAK